MLYDDQKKYMIFLYRDNYKSIKDLSIRELRLGGLRIDPKTNIGSRMTYYNNVKIKHINDKKSKINQISGLPDNAKLSNIVWSPDQKKIALTNTTENGVELWLMKLETGTVVKLTEPNLNANVGDVINWFDDSESMLVKKIKNGGKGNWGNVPMPPHPKLKEKDAYPADPEDGYGWEKLFNERMCRHFYEDFGLEVRIARYHNVYGEYGSWTDGREKAPAALSRKFAESIFHKKNEIEIWGNGNQIRSFLYIDDCVRGTDLLFRSKFTLLSLNFFFKIFFIIK